MGSEPLGSLGREKELRMLLADLVSYPEHEGKAGSNPSKLQPSSNHTLESE
ncbi:MAG: hypothetical protein RMJ15_02165 [Nitrososphaerota archaeon]|nr:hypothetical protein [Candidatus Bathyarchaeota archaeon]MDW8022539.1 hypothetical protein [Nitrososphaerota archaeon]